MRDSLFPWMKTPSEVEGRINELIRAWEEEAASATGDDGPQRASAQRLLKEIVRETFMAHQAATDEDFERCWPRLRDDILCEHAAHMFNHVFGAHDDEEEWEEYDEDETFEDDFGGDHFDDVLGDDENN